MKKVHFMGIGGSGTNVAAAIAHMYGYEVSGCEYDITQRKNTVDLEKVGIKIDFSHDVGHLEGIDLLCVSPALFSINPDHPELVHAKDKGIPVVTWQEFVGGELQKDKDVVAVCGTKGKTSLTALCGFFLEHSGLDPTVLTGAKVVNWDASYRVGDGDFFVCEADEFNNNFLHYRPKIAVVTNIEMDHPEFFKDESDYVEAFRRFLNQVDDDGTIIACIDSPLVRKMISEISAKNRRFITYGEAEDAFVKLESFDVHESFSRFGVKVGEMRINEYEIVSPGRHDALNACAVVALARELGVNDDILKDSLRSFRGVARRFQLMGEVNSILLYDDYAHHPIAVKAVLAMARAKYPERRLVAVLQPHMYSRTKLLMNDLVKSLFLADEIIVTDIYASREKGLPIAREIHARDVVQSIHTLYPDKRAAYSGTVDETIEYLKNHIKPGDVVLNMGAGDNSKIVTQLLVS